MIAHPAAAWRPPVLLLMWTLALAALALYAAHSKLKPVLFSAIALWVVAGFWSAEMQPAPSPQAELVHFSDGLQRMVQGHIVRIRELSPRQPSDEGEGDDPSAMAIDIAIDAVEEITPDVSRMVPVNGGVRVTLAGHPALLRCGDGVQATLRMRTPVRYRDPGAWEYADYLAAQGIGATATSPARQLVDIVENHRAATFRCGLFAVQRWASDRLMVYVNSHANAKMPETLRLSNDDAGMLDAMLFGERDRLSHTLRLGFERTGSFHLFVVSGMHVALLAGALFYSCRRLRLTRVAATLWTISAVAGYALLTGFGAPVQRALLMSSIFLLARLLNRDRNVMNSLGAAALAVLVLSPTALFEASFQMTFLVIVAIGGIAIPLGEWSFLRYARAARRLNDRWLDLGMHPRLAEFRIRLRIWGEHLMPLFGRSGLLLPTFLVRCLLWFAELVLVGVVAELVMVLPMATYFHRATVFALPANILSIPLVGILAPAAVLTFVASLISPWIAVVPASATALMLHSIATVVGRISHLHAADLRIPGPSPWVFGIAVACWLTLCWLVRRSGRSAVIAAMLLPTIAGVVLWPEPAVFTADAFEVTAIDVGQGDSLLLVSPDGKTMLIDAGGPVGRGENAALTMAFDVGEDVVSPYLWSRRLRRLDVVVLTHAHSDHMGGMAAVLRNFRPKELWVSIDPNSEAYSALLKEAMDLGVEVRHMRAGDAREFGGASIHALAPAVAYANHGPPVNNDSLVLRVDFGRSSVMLEGDAEAASERAMLISGEVHPVTLLKVGHHGSRTSSTPELIAAAQPKMAVVSVGRDNTFGHPRPEVIERMADAHVRLYRTDRFGLTQFLLTRDGDIREIELSPETSSAP